MPNPKRRHSHSRTRKRRTHEGLSVAQYVHCPKCKQAKLPHVVCGNCGFYKGRTAENPEPKDE